MIDKLTPELQELVVRYIPLARKLAAQHGYWDIEESFAEAKFGLVEAARRFEPGRDIDFSTYATYWIRAKVQARGMIESQGQVRHVTKHDDRVVFFRLNRLLRILGDDVSDVVIAERLGVREQSVAVARARSQRKDSSLDAHETTDWIKELTSEGCSPLEQTLARDQVKQLHKAIKRADLSRRERELVRGRLLKDEPQSLAQFARRWGVSRERARQIEVRILVKLRKELDIVEGRRRRRREKVFATL